MKQHKLENPIPEIIVSQRDPNAPKISILKKEHINEATEVFAHAFSEGEPLTKFLGFSYDQFKPFATEVIIKAATDQLSLVALNKEGKIMGIVIGEDIINPIEPKHGDFLRPIATFLDTMSKPFKEMQFKRNKVIHIWITAVKEDIKGVGLSTILNNACVMLALNNGFSYVFAEFTSPLNEKFMNRFPDNIKCQLNFSDFVLDGEKPFAALEGGGCSYICSAAPHISIVELETCLMIPNTELRKISQRP